MAAALARTCYIQNPLPLQCVCQFRPRLHESAQAAPIASADLAADALEQRCTMLEAKVLQQGVLVTALKKQVRGMRELLVFHFLSRTSRTHG